MKSPITELSTAVLTGLNSDYLKNPQMAHTMPFTAEIRYTLASVFKLSFTSLNISRPALTNNHFFVNKLISELQLCRSKEDGKAYKYEDNLPVKYKHDKCYRSLEIGQPIRSTALYPVKQQPYEAIQQGGVAEGRYIVHTPLRPLPFQLFLLQFLKSTWLQPGRSSLPSPSESRVGTETPFHCPKTAHLAGRLTHLTSTWFNVWSTCINGSICPEAELITLNIVKTLPLHQGSSTHCRERHHNQLFWSMSPLPTLLVLPTCIRSFSSLPLQHGLLAAGSHLHMCTCSQIEAAQHFAKLSLCIFLVYYSSLDPVIKWKKLLWLCDPYHQLLQGFSKFLNSLKTKLPRSVS